jgi:hypothetical protein
MKSFTRNKTQTRWVLQVAEAPDGRLEYRNLYDRSGIPDDHWDEANARISEVSTKNIIKSDIIDVLTHPICEFEKGELPPLVDCLCWSTEERKWKFVSRLEWLPHFQVQERKA